MSAAERPQMSRQPALTGRRMGLYSWGPDSLLTPPRSLRTRLVVGVLGLVLVMAAVMNAFSAVSLRHALMTHTNSQLMATARRAVDRRRDLAQEARKASDEATQEDMENQGDQPDGTAGASGDPSKPRVPPGLDATGQSIGTLTFITPRTSSFDGETSETTACINKNGHYASISKEDYRLLLPQATEDRPVTVDLHHLGSYRVIATRDEASGSTVITGLSLEGDKGLIRTQLPIELAVALVGALAVALAGRIIVRPALMPLKRVAHTTHRVAFRPLEHGEVSIEDRVEKADLDSSAEIGQVGGALNAPLGHMESALATRQRSGTQVRQLVANTSHELRMLLTSIRGYTELICREGADANLLEETTCALERVHSESVRMTALVEDLLLLARLGVGRKLRREEVGLVGLLMDAVTDTHTVGPNHDWQLDLAVLGPPADATLEEAEDFLPRPPLVIGDEVRLHRVIVNPLVDVRVHTPIGGHVTTTLTREGDTLIVHIHDDGPRIIPGVRDRLFGHFARKGSSHERYTGSAGLGMSIALAVVQSHGGSIDVASFITPEDHGTTFSVRLPAATVEE